MEQTIKWLEQSKETLYKYNRLLNFFKDIELRKINDINYHLKSESLLKIVTD